jgi:hypothetical protein
VYGRELKSFWVTLYHVENINFINLLGLLGMYFCIPVCVFI